MKRWVALALLCLFGLTACNDRSMDSIVGSEPCIVGVVRKTGENACLIENETGEYWVSLDVENADSVTDLDVGDEIAVYYDGMIAESYPMQINTVYAITLRAPADRAKNDRP